MDYRKVKIASFFMMAAGVSFLFSHFSGISGLAVSEGVVAGALNIGIVIIILAIVIYILALQAERYPSQDPFQSEKDKKTNAGEMKKQAIAREARSLFIDLYAREPNLEELRKFIERMKREGKF